MGVMEGWKPPFLPAPEGGGFRAAATVMGHEIACTVAQVWQGLSDRFQVGERYIVQADVYVDGQVQAVGYALEGGYTQYALRAEPMLNGDAGCYLLRCPEHLSYAESAVVASYRLRPRAPPTPQGDWLVVLPHAPAVQSRCTAMRTLLESPPPADSWGVASFAMTGRVIPCAKRFVRSPSIWANR